MKNFISAIFILFTTLVLAQNDRQITYGIFAGGIYSKMDNLPDVIVPKGIYSGYSFDEKSKFGGMGGVFINWKYPNAKLSIQPEISFSFQSTDLKYNDVKGLNYKINFGYQNINTGVLLKFYPIERLYIGAGPFLGLNITKDAITYTSNGATIGATSGVFFQPDAVVQKSLRESLKGNDHFYFMFATGYEFLNKMTVGARYSLGMTDALSTEENGFRYSENKNRISGFSLYFGYLFDFDDSTNF
jgi:hypothetical protein